MIGLLVAVIALALGVRSILVSGSSAASCMTTAWDAIPAPDSLPAGWTIADSAFTTTGVSITLSGPAPADGSSGATTAYSTVTCFGDDAPEAMARSRAAAGEAGQTLATLDDLGDEAFSATDTTSDGTNIQFRSNSLVGYVAATSAVSATDLRAIAAAFDDAMRGALAGATPGPAGSPASSESAAGSPSASEGASEGPSESPSASAAAAELEGLLPATVNGVAMTRDSIIGSDALGVDSATRALGAALRSLGADPTQLHLAESYDDSSTIDVYELAFGITGLDAEQLRTAILTAWLSANTPGVTTSTVTLSGAPATAVDYGDQGTISYVLVSGSAVIVIETADQSLAAQVAAGLK